MEGKIHGVFYTGINRPKNSEEKWGGGLAKGGPGGKGIFA
ncbi:hypothetical protein B4135_2473 [Caldibacillus debilis]|uniref:Uncharacterized protein n=1 Tax=Caldibacillus debilis TaxID=301148 RepID=A0A150LZB0_9BACI|nr:hypothetical protein B4135_2473 [Caldibacillus debilis]